VSRMVRKLIRAGKVREKPGRPDGRTKILSLTPGGERALAGIHRFARTQVAEALKRLPPEHHTTVVRGLSLYAGALAGDKLPRPDTGEPVRIETGYAVNLLARCIEMHAVFYARAHGFGRAFEARVAAGLADFSERMEKPRNRFWRATQGGRIVGTIAIDGEDLGPGLAHLRWFIVDDGARGAGVGKKLLSAALSFCDARGFAETHLWTFRGLDTARRLYEAQGFELLEERPGKQWGKKVMEQRFVRKKPNPGARCP
ncbi:MAG: bifunctional helix-turn-helix transcriptional regulator/GNAT family N-acetyltransferase, partial [Rhodospirillaceae bacterium]